MISNILQLPEKLDNKHPFRQWRKWKIPQTDLTLIGYSRSNDKVFFQIPELNCCLDAGLVEGRQEDFVFITHTHEDHIADVAYLAAKKTGVSIYVPKEAIEYLDKYIQAKKELNALSKIEASQNKRFLLCGVSNDDKFNFNKNKYSVRVVSCFHEIPCVGYCFSQKKMRLKVEFQELKEKMLLKKQGKEFGKLIAQKRKDNVKIEEDFMCPIFAFLGDSNTLVFEKNPWIFNYPVIITECTFLEDGQKERAKKTSHTLWSELKPFVQKNPKVIFVLTHFSLRYSVEEILMFFQEEQCKSNITNLVIWAC